MSSAEPPYLEQRALEARNKEIVKAAWQECYGDHNIDAVEKYFHKDVIEHNPMGADGLEGQMEFAREWGTGREKEKIDIRAISAEGNLVWVHVKIKGPDGKDLAIMDTFRVENGKIAEHWDVIQAIPDLTESKNPHPMF